MGQSVHTFNASGLLSKWGFDDGDTPDDVADEHWRRSPGPFSPKHARDWRADVIVPIAEHLLVPALPVPVEFYSISTSHNPARVLTVDGAAYTRPTPPAPDPVAVLFNTVEVTFPVSYLVDVLDGTRSLDGLDRLSGIDLGLLTAAFAAGLGVDEIAALHADRRLDTDVLATMAALHQ